MNEEEESLRSTSSMFTIGSLSVAAIKSKVQDASMSAKQSVASMKENAKERSLSFRDQLDGFRPPEEEVTFGKDGELSEEMTMKNGNNVASLNDRWKNFTVGIKNNNNTTTNNNTDTTDGDTTPPAAAKTTIGARLNNFKASRMNNNNDTAATSNVEEENKENKKNAESNDHDDGPPSNTITITDRFKTFTARVKEKAHEGMDAAVEKMNKVNNGNVVGEEKTTGEKGIVEEKKDGDNESTEDEAVVPSTVNVSRWKNLAAELKANASESMNEVRTDMTILKEDSKKFFRQASTKVDGMITEYKNNKNNERSKLIIGLRNNTEEIDFIPDGYESNNRNTPPNLQTSAILYRTQMNSLSDMGLATDVNSERLCLEVLQQHDGDLDQTLSVLVADDDTTPQQQQALSSSTTSESSRTSSSSSLAETAAETPTSTTTASTAAETPSSSTAVSGALTSSATIAELPPPSTKSDDTVHDTATFTIED